MVSLSPSHPPHMVSLSQSPQVYTLTDLLVLSILCRGHLLSAKQPNKGKVRDTFTVSLYSLSLPVTTYGLSQSPTTHGLSLPVTTEGDTLTDLLVLSILCSGHHTLSLSQSPHMVSLSTSHPPNMVSLSLQVTHQWSLSLPVTHHAWSLSLSHHRS